jgi:hypothetical protein
VASLATLTGGTISLVYEERLDVSMSRLDSRDIQVCCYSSIYLYIEIRCDCFLGEVLAMV